MYSRQYYYSYKQIFWRWDKISFLDLEESGFFFILFPTKYLKKGIFNRNTKKVFFFKIYIGVAKNKGVQIPPSPIGATDLWIAAALYTC